MFGRVLRKMREFIRTSAYIMTVHANEEMEADRLSMFDVEHCILTGEITERQRDRNTAEWKYLVQGSTLSSGEAVVVSKIGPTGKLVIVTVYRLER